MNFSENQNPKVENKNDAGKMKLLLLIVKLSVYSVLTYLVMVVITVLAPTSEQNLLEGNTKEEKTETDYKDAKLRTILKASDKKNFPMAIPNNVDLSCLKENGSLIVVVKSKIDNFNRRQDIR